MKQGLHKDKDVQKVIEEARKKILIARLLKDRVDDSIEITDEAIIEDYSQNQGRYMTPEIMRVSHILVPTRGEAEDISKQLKKGKSFEEMAICLVSLSGIGTPWYQERLNVRRHLKGFRRLGQK